MFNTERESNSIWMQTCILTDCEQLDFVKNLPEMELKVFIQNAKNRTIFASQKAESKANF